MKFFLLIAITATLCNCNAQKETRVKVVDVQLIRKDIVRQANNDELMLTWKSNENVEYVSFEPLTRNYEVGSRTKMTVKR